jgi:NAD(P)-dependent dehydrogenase (short-subunit alcohol dehydrogenase family)
MSLDHAKTAVITGAGSGIGRAIALGLAEMGYRVGIVDIDPEAAGETLGLVEGACGRGEAFQCDVCDFDAVRAMADHFFDAWGEVGMLVNNAGIGGGGYVGEISVEDWEKVLDTDVMGVVHGCTAFVPRLKAQGRGHIVNTASTAGLVPAMGFAPYSASKAAVVALSEILLVELAPFGIGVTVLCPSTVRTNIMDNSLKVLTAEGHEALDWGKELINTGMERSKVTCEDVARMLLEGVEKDRLFVVTNRPALANWRDYRLAPERYFKLLAFLHRKGLLMRFMMSVARKGNI